MNDGLDFIPSKASLLKSKDANFESVVFESYKSAKKAKKSTEDSNAKEIDGKNELNMKEAKHEIIKLGMSGLNSKKKEEAKINLLIQLGAKPPKRKNKNYKELCMERKKAKEKEAKTIQLSQLGKNQHGRSTAKGKSFDRKRKKENNILSIYGKVQKNK
ncbi:uncharacterized protein LOC126881971 [Diabrotica virgifera virgifera]|uniref:Uncharacterized protein n=1 Tax=Diabrotica virgifera virgifera TaxID=50390 RepID=A0ABM5JXK8_DIAVI|nr:uncharacterized protein LOC126881971 [Diabrotica virgifera virgifera]